MSDDYVAPDLTSPVSRVFDAELRDVFKRQLTLQRESFGVDPESLTDEQRDEFIRWNALALMDELSEALDEVNWKPWASAHGFKDRDAFVKELVDLLHFLTNLFLAAGADADEVIDRYFAKAAVNAKRQAEGYDGISTKCEHCGRALDEPGRNGSE
jgi:dimeric dUTPase (all-alpha-NTP-PPase superfamily)